jgi:hypothetical protein
MVSPGTAVVSLEATEVVVEARPTLSVSAVDVDVE